MVADLGKTGSAFPLHRPTEATFARVSAMDLQEFAIG
jgi:hypothetical protein